jgi:hypothetical protein
MKPNEKGKTTGASLGNMNAFSPSMDPELYKAISDLMVGFQLVVMELTNTRNGHALAALQTITGKLFERAAHCFSTGANFTVGE